MGLYGGMKMKKKSLVFIMALMCLVIGCAINATIVNAKTNPNVIERKTDDITVGKYEITLGKYDSSAKVIMKCKEYTIADSFYNEKMILYRDDSLKTVNVKNNIVTELVKNPCIQSLNIFSFKSNARETWRVILVSVS